MCSSSSLLLQHSLHSRTMNLRERSGSGSGKIAKLQPQTSLHDGDVTPFSFTKLLKPDADWDRDQLGDVLHWARQAVGLVCGILWGAIPLTGVIWLIVFVALSTGLVFGYYAFYLKVDEEEFGGHGPLIQEGLFASLTLFLFYLCEREHRIKTTFYFVVSPKLAWILVYSVTHFQ